MENENIKNDNNDINELVDRAMNDINQADKNEESKDDTSCVCSWFKSWRYKIIAF